MTTQNTSNHHLALLTATDAIMAFAEEQEDHVLAAKLEDVRAHLISLPVVDAD